VHQVGFSLQNYIKMHRQQNTKFNSTAADMASLDGYCWNQPSHC